MPIAARIGPQARISSFADNAPGIGNKVKCALPGCDGANEMDGAAGNGPRRRLW
jgi:hypothetical protein